MIHVYKNWYINADSKCYSLFQIVDVKTKSGEIVQQSKNATYHPSVAACLKCFCKIKQRKLTATKDMELYEAIKRFEKVESLVISIAEGDKIELKERK